MDTRKNDSIRRKSTTTQNKVGVGRPSKDSTKPSNTDGVVTQEFLHYSEDESDVMLGQDVMWSQSMIPDMIRKPVPRFSHNHYDPALTESKWEKLNSVQSKFSKNLSSTTKHKRANIDSQFKSYIAQLPPYDLLKIIGQDKTSQVALLINVIAPMFPHLYRTMLDISRSSLTCLNLPVVCENKTRCSKLATPPTPSKPQRPGVPHVTSRREMEESDCFIADPETCWQEIDELDFWARYEAERKNTTRHHRGNSLEMEQQQEDLAPTETIVDFISSVCCPLASLSGTKLGEC